MTEEVYHIPALLPQTLEALAIRPGGIYIDVTYGGGGHSRAIVERLDTTGHLYGFDQDSEAVERAFRDPRFTIVHSNFRFLRNFMRYHGVEHVDGILADLGVSFHHFDDSARGFSFRWDGPLDMRMNQRSNLTAGRLIAENSEESLANIFSLYGELRQSRRIAAAIVKARSREEITTIEQLLAVVRPLISLKAEKKELAQVFQALRIAVNGELDALSSFLDQATSLLAPGGRLAIITYHSLEDRMVKNYMKTGNIEGRIDKDFFGRTEAPLRQITSKPVVPDEDEINRNPRSRSAKLRTAVKL